MIMRHLPYFRDGARSVQTSSSAENHWVKIARLCGERRDCDRLDSVHSPEKLPTSHESLLQDLNVHTEMTNKLINPRQS